MTLQDRAQRDSDRAPMTRPVPSRPFSRRLVAGALLPFSTTRAVLASPVLHLEFRIYLLRSPLPHLVASAFVALCGLVFIAALSGDVDFQDLGPSATPLGKQLFFFLGLLAVFYTLFVPSWLTCSAFSREVRQKTFDLLTATSLTPTEVVGGKVVLGFLRSFLPLFASLPFLILAVQVGGVNPWELAKHAVLFASVILFVTTLGVLWSLIFRPFFLAGIVTFLGSLFIVTISGTIVAIIFQASMPGSSASWIGISALNLLLAFLVWLVTLVVYRKLSQWDY